MYKAVVMLITSVILSLFISCNKGKRCKITATITQTGTPCSSWGIKVGTTYPSYNIPDEFKYEGEQVCVEYELYEDYTLCACCGGTRARIIKMTFPPD